VFLICWPDGFFQGNNLLHHLTMKRAPISLMKAVLAMCDSKKDLLLRRNFEGATPLDIALKNECHEIAEFLKAEAAPLQLDEKPSVRFQICSDLHIEFYGDEIPDLVKPVAPILCLLGDIGLACMQSYREFILKVSKQFERVFVIAGNHGKKKKQEKERKQSFSSLLFFFQNTTEVLSPQQMKKLSVLAMKQEMPSS
jgi:hypothetical protein